MGNGSSAKSIFTQARDVVRQAPQVLGKEIWHTKTLEEKGPRAFFFGVLRVMTITVEGVLKNRIPSQAAALSYYTLIALGPLIAIVIMVSGFVVRDNQDEVATKALTKLIYFIAPSAEQAEMESEAELDNFFGELDINSELNTIDGEMLTAESLEGNEEHEEAKARIAGIIGDLVENARSGAVGVVGSLILIVISIQLLATIEKTFNGIWGVRNARGIAQQVVFYWTFISLGAVIGFTALTIGTVSAIARRFESMPFFGELLRDWFVAMGPLLAFLLVIVLVTCFNRFIPNTRVRWLPALLGATIVALLLYLNQAVSFLYIGFVVRQKSLFGAVGILPILLFGLFIFWLILLLGGQLTYAIQNANALTNQRAWENVSLRTREALALAALLLVARRFDHCEEAYSTDELSAKMRVPGNTLNETLTRLCDLGYLSVVENVGDEQSTGTRYQPKIPLERITLAGFKERMETFGNNDGRELIETLDPLLPYFQEHYLAYERDNDANKSLAELLKQTGKANA